MTGAFGYASLPSLVALGAQLAGEAERELVIASPVTSVAELGDTVQRLGQVRERLGRGGGDGPHGGVHVGHTRP